MTKRWDVAITGYGNVGKAVAKLLLARQQRYLEIYQADVRLTAVCGLRSGRIERDGLSDTDLEDKPSFEPGLTGERFMQALQADVLFEAGPTDFRTGGSGYTYIRHALEHQLHVVAISKGALVFDYQGLRELASRKGVTLHVSGATAAALPTIDLLTYNLAGCEVDSIEGILTATTNVILSQMMEHGSSFEAALRYAQEHRIVESDPSFDVDGWDTACKLTILANAGLGASLTIDDIARESLRAITGEMVEEWLCQKLVPKFVGQLTRLDATWQGAVKLRLYQPDHPFAQATGQRKAIRVVTALMGEFFVIGGNAGPAATAAAALKDFEHLLSGAR